MTIDTTIRRIVPPLLTLTILLAWTAWAAPVSAQEGAQEAPPEASRPAADEDRPRQLEDPGILHFEIVRTSSEIEIDGRLDEPAWQEALSIPLGYEWFPGDNVVPPVATECLVTYDRHNLYVAFVAHDPRPEEIRAHLTDRDNVRLFVQNDHVGFQVDPFNDQRRAFQFRINPLGVQVDAVFSEIDQVEDFSWDAIWSSRGRITAEGYVVEVAVPLEQLRFPRAEGDQTWGFEAFRSYPRSARHRISSKFTDRNKDCTLCQENKISGISGIRPGLNLELDPTVTVQRTDVRNGLPDGPLESGDEDTEAGLSGRWGITPNVTLSGTVNPDFSQVEADAAQLEVNTRFALFFPEKRPFFLEGADFYTTPLQAVFTRTVADPAWGAKVTGKEGKNALGVFVARDRRTNLLLPSNQGSRLASLDDDVTSSVFRYRRDVGANSTLGVLYTGRDGSDYSNDVYGLDGFLRFNSSNALRFQYLRSDTSYPGGSGLGDDLSGDGWLLQYDYLSRDWVATIAHTDLAEDFRADSGFIPRVDVKTTEGRLFRRIWGNGDTWYDQLIVGTTALYTEDQAGDKTDDNVQLFVDYVGPYQSFVEIAVSMGEELFRDTLYDTDRQSAEMQIKPTGDLAFSLRVETGDAIDFTNAQPADVLEIQPGVEMRIGRHVNLRLDHVRQRLDVDAGELYTVDLSQALLVYQFNTRAFLRGIFQYQDLDQNPDAYDVPVQERQKDLFSQLLFSYEVNPQTVLFLGYNDNRLGTDQFSLTQRDRTFFLKVGYALLF